MGELDEAGRLQAYVADLQSSLNAHLVGLGACDRLEIDGEWGPETDLAFRRVCRVLGLQPQRSVRAFRLVVGATQRTQLQPPLPARALPSMAEHSFIHGSVGKPAAIRQALAKLPHHGLPIAVPVARFQRSISAPRLACGASSSTPRFRRAYARAACAPRP
jgi:hypothetical protein